MQGARFKTGTPCAAMFNVEDMSYSLNSLKGGYIRDYIGIYWDNGEENGKYYLGFRVWGSGLNSLGGIIWGTI